MASLRLKPFALPSAPMKIALVISVCAAASALYVAWLNGVFRRCPYCRKIGSWRFDPVSPAVIEKDEDDAVQKTTQLRLCRKCGQRVLDTWSDHGGRTIEKVEKASK